MVTGDLDDQDVATAHTPQRELAAAVDELRQVTDSAAAAAAASNAAAQALSYAVASPDPGRYQLTTGIRRSLVMCGRFLQTVQVCATHVLDTLRPPTRAGHGGAGLAAGCRHTRIWLVR